MGLRETGNLIGCIIQQETNYGVPVAPTAAKSLPVISVNFQDDENLVEDRTVFLEDPDLRSEKPGHFQPTFEIVLGIPVYSSGNPAMAADSPFIDLMEFIFGKSATLVASGTLPTYMAADAFFGVSGAMANSLEMGNRSNTNSFTAFKPTLTGHEVGYGCVIQNMTIRGGLDQFIIVTLTGGCRGVSKFQEGIILGAALTAADQNFTVAEQAKGRIGVGSFIKFVNGSGFLPATGGRLVTAFNPDTRVGTYEGANLGISMAGNSAISSAIPDLAYSNYQEDEIFGDGSLVSVDGGKTTLTSVTSWEIAFNAGAMLYNRSVADLRPVGTYQQDRRITLTLESDVDEDNAALEKAAEQSSVKDVQILAGGLTAPAGALALFRFQQIKLRRSFPQSPREGLSNVRYMGMGRAKGFGASKASPLAMYIK